MATRQRGNGGAVHFTIGSAAGHRTSAKLDLTQDLALVKATLLYADRVKLCSPGSSILSGIAEFEESSPEAKARLVVRLLPDLQPSMSPQEVHFFEAVVGLRSREEKRRINRRTRKEILGLVEKKRGELEAMVLGQHKAAGIEGFREAVRSGLLEVHPFRQTSAAAVVEATVRGGGDLLRGFDLTDLLAEFIDRAMDAVVDASTYPLLDDLTGDFIAEAVSHGLLTPTEAGTMRGRYGGISADLLERLPLFHDASLSDVLAVRRELEGPLRGFRLAIRGYSREIRSAAWEPGFSEEADALFREKIKPEVEKIEEAVRANGYGSVAWGTARHGATPATFGALVGSASDLPTLAGAAVGALPVLGAAGIKTLLDRSDKLEGIRENQLYFYHRAGEGLEARRG